MLVPFTQSARRHRIGRQRLLWIGLDDPGFEPEVLAVIEPEYLLVVRVLPHRFRRRTR